MQIRDQGWGPGPGARARAGDQAKAWGSGNTNTRFFTLQKKNCITTGHFPFLFHFSFEIRLLLTRLTFTCSKSTIETLEKVMKHFQS